MSYKYIELILIITATFLILNKLFRILGQVEDNDVMANKAKNRPKDIEGFVFEADKVVSYNIPEDVVRKFVIQDDVDRLQIQLNELSLKTKGNFNLSNFMESLKKAIPMILSSVINKNEMMLKMLLDQRFVSQFQELIESNKVKLVDVKDYQLLISDVYFFANSAFIQVTIFCKNIGIEKWIFSHNTRDNSKEWLLSNIDNS